MGGMKAIGRPRFGGKYRDIILAVGFFLLLDLTALMMNFYVSFQISDDAVAINVAGRQRMLSQQVAKSLLGLQADLAAGRPAQASIDEVRRSAQLFDATLGGFEHGATVIGTEGRPVQVRALADDAARALVADTMRLWKPYLAAIEAAPASSTASAPLQQAIGYGREHGAELLGLANRLTTTLESAAMRRADVLRMIQVVVIVLALANFVFILFRFLRSLRRSDALAEAARDETDRILDTVNEGLFLLDRDGVVGSQMSTALPRIMGRPVASGSKFLPLLQTMVTPQVFASAADYVELLFGKRVKEALVRDLNPLQEIEVRDVMGGKTSRFLTLQFNRVKRGDQVAHLLVTVADVTEHVRLARELEQARRGARAEIAALLGTLAADRVSLVRFLADAQRTLDSVNDILQQPARGEADLRRTVASVFRSVHGLKGDAAALGLSLFEHLAHEFENTLGGLRDKATLTGEDLLALPPHLDEMIERAATVRDLLGAVEPGRAQAVAAVAAPPVGAAASLRRRLEALAARIAADHDKQVRVRCDFDGLDELPEPSARELGEIALQLLRNAVVHGIEPAADRVRLNKPATGTVDVTLRTLDSGDHEFVLRDDGHGIDAAAIREALRRSGRLAEPEIAQLSTRQLYGKLFEPGFSTAASVDEHAGRGVGLDLVAEQVRALGARLKLSSRPDEFTEFGVRFAVESSLEVVS